MNMHLGKMNDAIAEGGEVFNLAKRWINTPANPNKAAIKHEQGEITYQQLKTRVITLASAFEAIHLNTNSRIVIALDDGPVLHYSFLACLAFGAIPIVVNPKLGEEALQYILKDSGASALAINEQGKTIFRFFNQGSEINCISYQTLISYGDDCWQNFSARQPEDVAFMQYTSGTTGQPKGVMHSSQNALEIAERFAKGVLGATKDDVFYSLAKCFFGYGLGNSLIFPLELQASVLLDDQWPTVERVINNFEQHQPSIFFGVPAMYQALSEQSNIENALSSIRQTVSAGAALPARLFSLWQSNYQLTLLDGLGSTELCHVFCCHARDTAKPGSLGRPIAGYEIEIRDVKGEVVPAGTAGTLWVKGPSMTTGYWQNEQATAAKFIDGWYNSGDLAYIDEQGEVFFKGRADDLFKVNGRWVVPTDIEQSIAARFKEVVELALVPMDDEHGLTRGALWLVPRETTDNQALIAKVHDWCAEHLSSYQRPLLIQTLGALPRNDNGKVVRAKLHQTVMEVA